MSQGACGLRTDLRRQRQERLPAPDTEDLGRRRRRETRTDWSDGGGVRLLKAAAVAGESLRS